MGHARIGLGLLTLGLLAAACGGGIRAAAPVSPKQTTGTASCMRTHTAPGAPMPLASPRTGSTVALASASGRTLAYAADEDDWSIHVIDVDAGQEIGRTALDGRPSELMFLPDGRLVVLLRDKSQAEVLAPGESPQQLEKLCAVDTAPEPVGMALTPDDATLLVTSGWGHALAGFEEANLTKIFQVVLPREPRSVVVSDDGAFAYVSHAVGALASRVELQANAHTVVDVALLGRDSRPAKLRGRSIKQGEAAVATCQGYALAKSTAPGGRILAPQVIVETGDPKERAPGYGNDNTATEVPDVAVIDAATGMPIPASLERPVDRFGWGGVDPRDLQKAECLLPRAAAIDPKGQSLLVSCFGIDQVIAYDALSASPVRAERKRWSVGAGPSGIAVDPAGNRALVWSQFDRALSRIDLGDGAIEDDKGRAQLPVARIDVSKAASKITSTVALGRLLFHGVGDARISKDGRACASCHPDGRDDSLVWATPNGPRRSIMLAGRVVATAPYAWAGDERTLREHLATTFDRLNGEGGLRSMELDALVAYVEQLAPPPALATGQDAKAMRGEQLFASSEVGCATCHNGATGTDNAHHDVKSKTPSDKNAAFNTPTLRFVGGTGPYFHDGRYKTLHDLLTSNGDAMGHTKDLSADDLDALEAYLRTL